MFSRIAIVNRGEAAMRLIRAVRELSAETGTHIETVALYTDVDRGAPFVRESDLRYDLGPAFARPYLDLKGLARALAETGSDAAWVGWGFVAEDPAFADACEKSGVTFIGPSAAAMRTLGDKIAAKLAAEQAGVPVAPWSRGAVGTLGEAVAKAAEIGYPLMLKAASGGGGRGIRVVAAEADLVAAFERAGEEAARAFGDGTLFLERLVTGARHVEVQVIADGQGTAWALGVRDCSLQRRNQKVIEESASALLPAGQAEALKRSARRLALAVGYRGAATVEFLYHPGDKRFAFLEVNTRLQVEHPVTEATTGFDLVKAQLRIAAGGRLHGEPPPERGHAIEARLNAEDPDRDFAPSPGRIVRLDLPTGAGIRVDTGVGAGDVIPADFDSMIAKVIAWGRDRGEALGRLRRALAETRVLIEGGVSNKSFLLDLLAEPEVIDASADTGWIDRVRGEGRLAERRHSAVALAVAGIKAYEAAEQDERRRLLATARGGRPQLRHDAGQPLDLRLRGAAYRVTAARTGERSFDIAIEAVGRADGGASAHSTGQQSTLQVTAEIDRFDRHTGQVEVNGMRYRLVGCVHGPVTVVEIDGVVHRISRDEGGVIRAPAPALVVAAPVDPGAEVEAGAPVLVLESMKMETVLRAPFRARLAEYLVSAGTQVTAGAPLLRLEPLGTTAPAGDTAAAEVAVATGAAAVGQIPELALPSAPGSVTGPARQQAGGQRAERLRARLRGLLLGFDPGPDDEPQVLADYLTARRVAADGQCSAAQEIELVEVFADLAALTCGAAPDEDGGMARVHSAGEHFHAYLQTLDAGRAGLPAAFQDALARALRHYGVNGLERTAELEAAVFRIFLAQRRTPVAAQAIAELLRAWLREPPHSMARRDVTQHNAAQVGATQVGAAQDGAAQDGAALRASTVRALDRLAAAAQARFPALADLARGAARAVGGLRAGAAGEGSPQSPRARGAHLAAPQELAALLGGFTEYDLDDAGTLAPAGRPAGLNSAAIVAGVASTPTALHPQGITRVVLLGDPAKSLGALAEPECRRVIAALDLAQRLCVPLEWYALSSGARISMTSGTENMDWIAAVLRRIVEFTQGGGEVNVVVAGINVGAQPYWNAEATMLMHTRGILVMTPDSAMVLTGKRSLDFSGGVSADDNFGIGGHDRVMGPNGQSQFWAPSLPAARDLLMSYYDHTYVAPGEHGPRRAPTADPVDRDVRSFPHPASDSGFTTVGDVFSAAANPARKKPFDIRAVMRALSDSDHPVLERWAGMADAETAVVQEARLGGWPVCLIGIESRAVPRRGFPPADGPAEFTGGTLFPLSSKKTARAINAASGNRPVVVLANLSGFDGSPESMRRLQLEYGAEIGRAVVNFDGPMVFCVISRYHGGAFVVFSKALNPNLTVLAVEGAFASVLGGAPAAAVVFSADVDARTAADPRVRELRARAAAAPDTEQPALAAESERLRAAVRAEKIGEVAAEFDRVHSVQRAVEVGSVDAVIRAAELRPRIIAALGSRRCARQGGGAAEIAAKQGPR